MTTINRATWTDDDGSGTTGTILNNARLQGDIYDKVDGALATLDAKDVSQDSAIAANGPHSILSAQHPDTVPAALVAGDLLVGNATGKLARLAKGADGSALALASGAPAWTPMGQWTTYLLSAATLTAVSGTFTLPGGQAGFNYSYTTVGKIALVTLASSGPYTTSAATQAVKISLPAALAPLVASANLLGLIYTTTLTATVVNVTASGLQFFPNVGQTGTIPAMAGIYLSCSIFFALP
jgi:hypothetical protein